MKNFTTCLTRPTGESYKSPGGIMRYLMLLLMCLMTGVGMAQNFVEFVCNSDSKSDFNKTNNNANVSVIKGPITTTISDAWSEVNSVAAHIAQKNDLQTFSQTFTFSCSTETTITKVEIYSGLTNTTTANSLEKGTTPLDNNGLKFNVEKWSNTKVVIKEENTTTTKARVTKLVVYYKTDDGSTDTSVAPTYVNISANKTSVTVNEQFTLNAEADGTNPTYTWYKGSITENNNIGSGATLTLSESEVGTYIYKCVASNSKSSAENSIEITVKAATVSETKNQVVYTCGTDGDIRATPFDDNANDIHITFDKIESLNSNYFKFGSLTVTSNTKTIEKIVLNKVVTSDPSGTTSQDGYSVELTPSDQMNTTISSRHMKCTDIGNGLKVEVFGSDDTSTSKVYVYQMTVYYKDKSTDEPKYYGDYKCGNNGVITNSSYDDTDNDIHFNSYKGNTLSIDDIKDDYVKLAKFTFTSSKYDIYKIEIHGAHDNPNGNDITDYKIVSLEAGDTDGTIRDLKCIPIDGGLEVDVTQVDNTGTPYGIYVKNIKVYYREKSTEEYGIIIDHQNHVYVKPAGALTLKIKAHPENTAGRNYEWFINTEDSYDGGKLIGSTGTSKAFSLVVPQEPGDYWYYSVLTCRDKSGETEKTAVYKSNRIHVIVTSHNDDGLVIITPIENVETTVYNQTTISLEVNEEDDCTYTYQWYKVNNNINMGGKEISGANKRIYTFTPENTGTEYYYCYITRHDANGNLTGELTSRVGQVNITKAVADIDFNDIRLVLSGGAKTFTLKATVGDNKKTDVTNYLTFTVKENSDKDVATVSIDGNVLTVTPNKTGVTDITITATGKDNDNFNVSEGVATVTVVETANTVPGVMFKWGKAPNDINNFAVPETEDDVYEGNVLLVRMAPDVEDVTYNEDTGTWNGIEYSDGTWTTSNGKKYEIYYVVSDNENVKNGTKYTGSIRISQTMTVKDMVKDVTDSKALWGDAGEHTFMFNFTLIRTITNGLQIEPGKGYTIMDDDGRVYVTTTYGSVGDMGNIEGTKELWEAAKEDTKMNGSEIVGFDYHCIGNKDSKGENKWDYTNHKYNNYQYKYDGEADNDKLNTFDIPFTGSYFMFEPEVDGELNVIVRQNGIVGSNSNDMSTEIKKAVKRYAFVCDETGKSLPAVEKTEDYEKGVRALISSKSLAESKGFAFLNETFKDTDETDEYLDENGNKVKVTVGTVKEEDSKKKLQSYMEEIYKAHHDISEYTKADLATKAQKYWDECRQKYFPETENGDKNDYKIDSKTFKNITCDLPNVLAHDDYGWYTFGKAYVRYSFPVKAGKTYFMTGRWTKLAPCGYSFKRNNKDYNAWREEISKRKYTVDGRHKAGEEGLVELVKEKKYDDIVYYTDNTDENGNVITGNDGNPEKVEYARSTESHITLDRDFKAGVWTSLVVPFSMSPVTVREQFGIGTQIVHFNMVDDNKLHLTKHHHQMIVAGTPVFIKPTKKVSKVVVYGTYGQYESVITKTTDENNEEVKTIDMKWKFPNIREMDGNTNNGWKMTGSYEPATVPVGAYLMGYNPNTKENNLRHITMETKVPGTRAWIVNATNKQAKIEGLYINGVEDNTTTMIEEILYGGEPTTVKGTRANGVYSLSGQQLRANTTDTTGLPAGIYIVGGRKVVVR